MALAQRRKTQLALMETGISSNPSRARSPAAPVPGVQRGVARQPRLLNLALLSLPLMALFGAPISAHGKRPDRAFLRGVALGHHTDIDPGLLDRNLAELSALEASHVSLVVSWSTRDVRSTSLAPRKDYTTSDKSLLRMLERSRARGLKVILFPIIDVELRKPLEWRGTIKPTDWNAWWASYRRFILHYAGIAARGRASVLCVGSELVSTEAMTSRWVSLIRAVRKVFKGELLYSANWDHYEPVTFWRSIDIVGLTGYYRLAQGHGAGETEMFNSWVRIRDKIVGWARRIKRKVVFTEVGYPSLAGGAVDPWDYTQGTAVDLEEQRRAFKAFTRAWTGVAELGGVVFWDWYGPGGPNDTRYSPKGKPAEAVIRRWFRTLARHDTSKKR